MLIWTVTQAIIRVHQSRKFMVVQQLNQALSVSQTAGSSAHSPHRHRILSSRLLCSCTLAGGKPERSRLLLCFACRQQSQGIDFLIANQGSDHCCALCYPKYLLSRQVDFLILGRWPRSLGSAWVGDRGHRSHVMAAGGYSEVLLAVRLSLLLSSHMFGNPQSRSGSLLISRAGGCVVPVL